MGIEPITIALQITISKLYQLFQVFKFYSKKGFLVRFVESTLNICPKPKRTVLIKLKPNSIGIKPISRHWKWRGCYISSYFSLRFDVGVESTFVSAIKPYSYIIRAFKN